MGVVRLPDALQRVIERQVAEGRAASPAAFLEEAVMRLVDDGRAEEDEIRRAAEAGIADAEAGRYTTVMTPEDERLLHERLMARVLARSASRE
jgi:predicted transcriptional regulator